MPESSLSPPLAQSWLPGIQLLRTYDTKNLNSDLLAGLSVAAVAIPIGIAYAQLAGAPPVVGIYSCVLTPVTYALFGSSRQLIVNPDAAACAIVAATAAPMAAGDAVRYADLSITLTLLTGVLCIRLHQCILSYYCEVPRLVCCRTQFRFSPSIARSQYSPIRSPLGFASERLSSNRRT